MSKFLAFVFTAIILSGTSGWQLNSSFADTGDLPQQIHAPDRLIVKFNQGVSAETQASILSSNSASLLQHLPLLDIHIISVPEPALDSVKNALSKNSSVEYAEYDIAVEPTSIPNDPRYGNQWHLTKINSPASYDITHGEGFPIVILDSGIDMDHSDLQSNIIYPYNGITQTAGPVDHVNNCGHGTAVAGAAAAITNNNNGIASVGWNSTIIPVKITDDNAIINGQECYGWSNGVLNGVEWAVSHGAKVVNLSYGFDASSNQIKSAAQLMQDNNGWLVISAGNSGNDPNNTDDPRIIFVSSTTSSDVRSSFSSYGNYVDMSAPGSSIQTTSDGNNYNNWSGTSFSAPITASVLNLIYSVDSTLSSSEAFDILKNSAVDLGDPGWDQYYGYGRVDAYAAVLAASQGAPSITAANDNYNVNEDNQLNVLSPGILQNDVDVNQGQLTASLGTGTSNGILSFNSNGSFTYTPSTNFDGVDSFTYRATNGVETSSLATVTITVNPVNDKPVAGDDSVISLKNTPTNIDVLQNDSDVDGDLLSVQSFTQGTSGAVAKNGDGTLSYTPQNEFVGIDTFTYLVSDGNLTDEATVTVDVLEPIQVHVGDLEISKTGNKRWTANAAITVHDKDENPVSGLSVQGLWSGGSSGSDSCITNANGICQTSISTRGSTLTFTVSNIVGTGFEYSAGDNHDVNGNSDGNSITINADGTIPGQNSPPVASNDSVTTSQDQSVQINVLSNDSDSDNDVLSVISVGSASSGNVETDGLTITYTPNGGFIGEDSFDYTISDGNGGTDTATVTVTVNGTLETVMVHIDSLSFEVGSKGPWNTGTVTITVHDSNHTLQSGVTVSGTWTGLFSGNASCITDSTGTCSVNDKSKDTGNATFTVTDLSGSGFGYDSSKNESDDSISSSVP